MVAGYGLGEREWKIVRALRTVAQRQLAGSQAHVVAGSLGVHRAAVYSLRSRFLKGHNGYSDDL